MELIYDHWKGSLNIVKEPLTKSLAQYIRSNRKVKIGITNRPQRHLGVKDESSKDWKKMVVKYRTPSMDNVTNLKKILVDNFKDQVENESNGMALGDGPYYLYVMLK